MQYLSCLRRILNLKQLEQTTAPNIHPWKCPWNENSKEGSGRTTHKSLAIFSFLVCPFSNIFFITGSCSWSNPYPSRGTKKAKQWCHINAQILQADFDMWQWNIYSSIHTGRILYPQGFHSNEPTGPKISGYQGSHLKCLKKHPKIGFLIFVWRTISQPSELFFSLKDPLPDHARVPYSCLHCSRMLCINPECIIHTHFTHTQREREWEFYIYEFCKFTYPTGAELVHTSCYPHLCSCYLLCRLSGGCRKLQNSTYEQRGSL